MKHALCLIPVTNTQKELLQQTAPEYEFTFKLSKNKDLTAEEVERSEIIIGNTSPKLVSKAKQLKWFQLFSAGADNYIAPGILQQIHCQQMLRVHMVWLYPNTWPQHC